MIAALLPFPRIGTNSPPKSLATIRYELFVSPAKSTTITRPRVTFESIAVVISMFMSTLFPLPLAPSTVAFQLSRTSSTGSNEKSSPRPVFTSSTGRRSPGHAPKIGMRSAALLLVTSLHRSNATPIAGSVFMISTS